MPRGAAHVRKSWGYSAARRMEDGIAMDFISACNGREGYDVQCHMDPTEVRKHHCERSYRPRSGESLATHTITNRKECLTWWRY